MKRLFNNISNDVYRSIISNNPDAIFLLDENGKVLDSNSAAANIYGYSAEEMLNLYYPNIIIPSTDYSLKTLMDKSWNGETCAYQASAYHKNGSVLYLQVKNVPMLEEGKTVGVMVVAKDETELTQTRLTLQETSEKFISIFNSSADAIDIIDINGDVMLVNPAFEEMYGWNKKELIGKKLPTIPKSRLDAVKERREKAILGEYTRGLEVDCIKKDGTSIDMSITISPLLNGEEKVVGFLDISRDITERKKMESDLRDSKNRYKSLLNVSPEAICVHSQGVIRYINEAGTKLFGYYHPSELLNRHILDFTHINSQETVRESIRMSKIDKYFPKKTIVQTMLRADSSTILVEATILGIEYEDEPAIQVIYRDITERKMLLDSLIRSEEKYRLIAENMTDLVSLIDENGILKYISPSFQPVLGFPIEELQGTKAREQVHSEDFAQIIPRFKSLLNRTESVAAEFRIKHKTKGWLWVEAKATYFIDEEHGKPFLLVVSRDIEERKKLQEKLKSMAFHDGLTGLPNRRLFGQKMQQVIKEANRKNQKFALLYMDIDKFKRVNDNLGHSIGDELLKLFGERVSTCLRDSDILARQGGDEFTALLLDIESGEKAKICAKEILESLQREWIIDGHSFKTTSSIGIALYPSDGTDMDTLMVNADKALYAAKGNGRNRFVLSKEV